MKEDARDEEILRDKENIKKIKRLGVTAGGIKLGTLAGGYIARTDSKIAPSIAEKENKKLVRILTEEANKQGTKVKLDKIVANYDPALDLITSKDNAATLAHELGHSKHYKGRDGSKIGKIAHKVYRSRGFRNGASLTTGIATGYKAAKDEDSGKKASTSGKIATVAVPLAIATPTLIAEAVASKGGIQALKNAGASKEAIKIAKRQMGAAYGTYLSGAGLNVASGLGGRAAGRNIYRLSKRLKNKRHENTKKDE